MNGRENLASCFKKNFHGAVDSTLAALEIGGRNGSVASKKGMHGVSSGCSLLVNAEVDSMGGVIGADGIDTKNSPHQAAIEIAQAELRLEFDVREERRRELEFLEKGGDPLHFRFALAASLSVQSTSVADQIHDQLVTSEAKGSFAVANSPRGDSVESNGILGFTLPCEPNSADNFNVENDGRSNIAPSEHSSQVDGSQHVRESDGSPSFQPNKAYKRRNRSKANRVTARISSTDIASHGALSPSLPSFPVVVPRALKNDLQTQDINDGGVPDSIIKRVEALPEDDTRFKHLSEPNQSQGDGKCLQNEDVVNKASSSISMCLDYESPCIQTSLSLVGNRNMDCDLCTSLKNVGSKGDRNEQKVHVEQTTYSKHETVLDDRKVSCTTENISCLNDNHDPQSSQAKSYPEKDEEESDKHRSSSQLEAKRHDKSEDMQPDQLTNTLADNSQDLSKAFIPESEHFFLEKPQGPQDQSVPELNKADISEPVVLELPPPAGNQTEVVDKAHDDRLLEEARIIEAKRKTMNELSIGPLPKEYRRKSHWDFVLEEMAWMANDFAQERLWKRTTSSQLCQRAAFASRIKLEEQKKQREVTSVAQTLAKAVMEFWGSAGFCSMQPGTISGFEARGDGKIDSENKYRYHNGNCVNGGLDEEPGGENTKLAVQRYMVRFMQDNSSSVSHINIEAFRTSERESLCDMPELSSLDQRTEEDLFYAVPHGAMEAYRKSIEIYTMQCEKAGKNMLQDADTSMNDSFPEFGSQENEYEEDEGESVYQFSGAFGGRKQPKFFQKRGRIPKSYTLKSYEVDRDFPYEHCMENRIRTPQSVTVGKRPPNGLNVGPIPTKRVRTASRQRVLGPTMGGAGFIPVPRRTDASSGDTNSFQDDQTTAHGGSFIPRGLEVESRMDFDKQMSFDSAETTVKSKKKKKNKYQGEAYANMHGEQKDHLKRRMEYHQYESSGNGGLMGSHAKKIKIMKHSMDNSFENTAPISGSVPSNMSNQNKLIKLISGRDRGRKSKGLKVPSGQAGSGSPWSLFEDQALVVLVHDMGPNWELVSDAINSTLYFKCIFRKPKECKDRHKVLIEKNCADGADSADDSGCSQPYPSTLPGIPKGGARQLFQQLRGPIEEDTIKSHFEKIILLGQLLHGRKKQEPKQLVPVHGSHASALLQVTNSVNGGVLTPLDLCDMVSSSPDIFSLNYQSPNSGGLPLANQGIAQPTSSLLQGPSGMGHASNVSSPSGQLNSPASGGRYGLQRTSLPVNEQHRAQRYNPMLSARNIHQTNTPISGSDRGMRALPGGNGMVMPGMSRNTSIPRAGPGQGNTGSPNMASMPLHSGASPGQGNSIQPRDSLHMVGQNTEQSRPIMPPEMQLHGGPSSTFHNHPASQPAPSIPVHNLQGAEQQAFVVRIARERQLQQRIIQRQQQQQFPTSSGLSPRVPHHPLPNGMQNSSHVQSQSPPITPVSSQQQQKHLNGVGITINQGAKQRQLQQSARQHPLHQQQPKISKGNMSMQHQNAPADLPHSNGSQLEKMPSRETLSRNHQQLKVHPSPALKLVNNNSKPTTTTVQRTVPQNCVSDVDHN